MFLDNFQTKYASWYDDRLDELFWADFVEILKVLCYFWLAIAKYDFKKSIFFKVNFGPIQKVANETPLSS